MSQIPRGYILNKNPELQTVYEKVCEKAKELGMINYIPRLYLFKSTKTWGWARYNVRITRRNYKYEYKEYGKPIIALNIIFLKDINQAIRTIVHECAHVATYEYNKERNRKHESHGDTWYSQFKKLGEYFNLKEEDYVRCTKEEGELKLRTEQTAKYVVYCNHCHKEIRRSRRCSIIEHPEIWKCGVCGTDLSKNKEF